MSHIDFVRKKPTLKHAVENIGTTQRDVHQYLVVKGFEVGGKDEEHVYLGLKFIGLQLAGESMLNSVFHFL